MKKNKKLFQSGRLGNQLGFSLLEVLLAVGIMAIIAGTSATMMVDQNRQVKQLSQKTTVADLKNSFIMTMQDLSACAENLNTVVDATLTFDSTIVGNKQISVHKIRVGSSITSPIIAEVNKEFSSGSGVIVDSIVLDNLTDIGSGRWSGLWKINFRGLSPTVSFKPITLNPQTFGVDLTIPTAAKITSCYSVSGGGASQWTTVGSDIYYNTGKVGIGTTTPGNLLSVAGDVDFAGSVYFASGADRTIMVDAPASGAGNMLTVRAGNYGGSGGAGGNLNLSGGDGSFAGGRVVIDGGSGGTNSGDVILQSAAGNVGIRTTSPQTALDVNGVIRVAKYAAQPFACDAAHDSSVALTSGYRQCACNGGTTIWVFTSDGITPCTW